MNWKRIWYQARMRAPQVVCIVGNAWGSGWFYRSLSCCSAQLQRRDVWLIKSSLKDSVNSIDCNLWLCLTTRGITMRPAVECGQWKFQASDSQVAWNCWRSKDSQARWWRTPQKQHETDIMMHTTRYERLKRAWMQWLYRGKRFDLVDWSGAGELQPSMHSITLVREYAWQALHPAPDQTQSDHRWKNQHTDLEILSLIDGYCLHTISMAFESYTSDYVHHNACCMLLTLLSCCPHSWLPDTFLIPSTFELARFST